MYMQTYNPEVIVYFPMVKATVRALDTMEDYAKKQWGLDITQHMVAGASKRGWDTWLTGAVDDRVVAIAPIVMDMLNLTNSIPHMYQAYGGWTFAFTVRAVLVCWAVCVALCRYAGHAAGTMLAVTNIVVACLVGEAIDVLCCCVNRVVFSGF